MLENNSRKVPAKSNRAGLSNATFNRVTREKLRCWYPYKVKVRKHLKENDFKWRLDFSYLFLQKSNSPRFLSNSFTGENALFAMNGAVNNGM